MALERAVRVVPYAWYFLVGFVGCRFAAGLFICCICTGLSGQPLLADCAGACVLLVFVHVLLVVFDDRNILRLLNGTNGSSSMRVAVGC